MCKSIVFGHLAANVRVRCSDFSELRVCAVYSNRRPLSLFGELCEILRPADMKNVEEIVGTREAVATDSGGAATRRLVTRRRRPVG